VGKGGAAPPEPSDGPNGGAAWQPPGDAAAAADASSSGSPQGPSPSRKVRPAGEGGPGPTGFPFPVPVRIVGGGWFRAPNLTVFSYTPKCAYVFLLSILDVFHFDEMAVSLRSAMTHKIDACISKKNTILAISMQGHFGPRWKSGNTPPTANKTRRSRKICKPVPVRTEVTGNVAYRVCDTTPPPRARRAFAGRGVRGSRSVLIGGGGGGRGGAGLRVPRGPQPHHHPTEPPPPDGWGSGAPPAGGGPPEARPSAPQGASAPTSGGRPRQVPGHPSPALPGAPDLPLGSMGGLAGPRAAGDPPPGERSSLPHPPSSGEGSRQLSGTRC